MKLHNPLAPQALQHSSGSTPLEIGIGREYVASYDDSTVDEFAREDGQAAAHNPEVWDENTHPHFMDSLVEAAITMRALVGRVFRTGAQDTFGRIEKALPKFLIAEKNAIHELNQWGSAVRERISLQHEILRKDLSLPQLRDFSMLVGGLVALYFGELGLVAVGYQMLGLSDAPWVPGLAFTDDLHLASLATVVSIVFLAHGAGSALKANAHKLERRRDETNPDEREQLPKPSLFSWIFISATSMGAIIALIGVSTIRIEYLLTLGVPAQAWPFMVIQIALLCAGVYLSFHFSNPYAKRWFQTVAMEKLRTRGKDAQLEHFTGLAGTMNTDVELVNTQLAEAGHHVRANDADTNRQIALVARADRLSQPEPVTVALMPDELPAPEALSDHRLAKTLIGVTDLPEYVKVSVGTVAKHHGAIVAGIASLEERIEKLRTAKLLAKDEAAMAADEAEATPPAVGDVVEPTLEDELAAFAEATKADSPRIVTETPPPAVVKPEVGDMDAETDDPGPHVIDAEIVDPPSVENETEGVSSWR